MSYASLEGLSRKMSEDSKVPLSVPDLRGNEEKYASEAISSTWISSTGAFVSRFETEFSAICGVDATIAVCNGTIALQLAMLSLGVGIGDEVLVPSLTFVATANAVRHAGAEPVFVDVDPNNWCIDPALLEASITPNTKGIIAVHLYGHPADMDEINRIAELHGLWVVEDAAEAHFSLYKGQPVGSFGKIATFSFYGNKILTCGEGGALTLSDPDLEKNARLLQCQGMDRKRRYYFEICGYNFRLSNVSCAILCAQMERRSEIINDRNRVFRAYRELLDGIPGIEFQPVAAWADPAPWLFNIVVDQRKFGHSRDQLMDILEQNGIETRPFFIPIHTLPPYRQQSIQRGDHLPITDSLGEAGMSLPTFPTLQYDEIKRVSELIIRSR